MKIYEYSKCSTCRKAIQFLESKKLKFERIPIVDKPPSMSELKKMLQFIKDEGGSIKNLFNTSGEQYRELKVTDKMKAGLSEIEALKLLSTNGKLIKRPFLISEHFGITGFQPELWNNLFKG